MKLMIWSLASVTLPCKDLPNSHRNRCRQWTLIPLSLSLSLSQIGTYAVEVVVLQSSSPLQQTLTTASWIVSWPIL